MRESPIGYPIRNAGGCVGLPLNNPATGLWPGARAPLVLAESSEVRHTEYDLYLLHHFAEYTSASFGEPKHTSIYSNAALNLAKESPLVMHAMIAVAACHLQHLGVDARPYQMAEAFHCQYASRGLRNSVTLIRGLKDSDSILTTAMLLNTLTFCYADYRDEINVDADCAGEPRWDWLRIQIGLTDLLMRTKPFHSESIWILLFTATHTFEFTEPPCNNLDEQLAAFCEVDENSNSENNVYFDMVERLQPLVVRRPSRGYLLFYLYPIGGISSRFIDLLEAKETRALLLFAHWLALMCSIDQWWCVRRVRRECRMVCSVLSMKLGPENLELLRRPAEACGFPFIFDDS